MFATGLGSPWAAPLVNGIGLLLALGFHRNRAVLVLVVLTCASLAIAGYVGAEAEARGHDASRMFAPWLLLLVAAMPERGFLARRNLTLIALIGIAIWLTLGAPAHVWTPLHNALPLGVLPWSAATVATILTLMASALCLLRWLLIATPMEAGLGVVLLAAACSLLPSMSSESARMGSRSPAWRRSSRSCSRRTAWPSSMRYRDCRTAARSTKRCRARAAPSRSR